MKTIPRNLCVYLLVLGPVGMSPTVGQEQDNRHGPGDTAREIHFCGTRGGQPARVEQVPPGAPRGAFQIAINYSGSGFSTAQQAVFDAAISMWEGVIQANGGAGTFTITNPAFTPLTAPTLGVADNFVENGSGIPLSARIRIDSGTTWFVDSTPFDNVEYTQDSTNRFQFLNGQGNAANADILSVILHEIGHAVGWTVNYTNYNGLVSAGPGTLRTFDSGGFEITLGPATGGTHADPGTHAGELMVPAIGGGTRRLISYFPTMTAPQRAYSYGMRMTFLDSGYSGLFEFGTAAKPFDTYVEGISGASSGDVLIIKAGSYPISAPVVADLSLILRPVLGTATIGAP